MSTKSEVKQEAKVNLTNFKPWASPRRKAGLRDDQLSIGTHSITLPVSVANKLGEKVALLWSDADKAIAIQKAADGDYKLRQVGKTNRSRSIYCKTLIDVKKVKKGRYTARFDEKSQMLVASVA